MSSDLDTLHTLSEHSASPVLLTSIGPHGAEYSFWSPLLNQDGNKQGPLVWFTVWEKAESDKPTQNPLIHCFTRHNYIRSGSSYPEGNFRRNQLLGGSMSLSPLCPCVTSNLHVSTVRPASITVSHDFTVQGYSSPPFGSNYQCFDSKLNPMDSRSAPVEGSLSPERELDTCTGFAFTTHHRPQNEISLSRFCKPYSFILALTVDSLIRVTRREALIPFD